MHAAAALADLDSGSKKWTNIAGPVAEAPGENWKALASALWAGNRGMRGGETLRQFLLRHGRDVPETRGRSLEEIEASLTHVPSARAKSS